MAKTQGGSTKFALFELARGCRKTRQPWKLAPRLSVAELLVLGNGAVGGTVTKSGIIFATGGGSVLYALDTRDGRVLWQHDLPAGRGYSNPVTYRAANGRQFVVIASGAGENAELVAFALRR